MHILIGLLIAVLVVSIVCIVGGLALKLGLPEANKRGRAAGEVLIHIGAVALVGDGLGLAAHYAVMEEMKADIVERIGNMGTAKQTELLTRLTGMPEVANEVVESILTPRPYYSAWNVEAALSYLAAGENTPDERAKYVRARVTYSWVVNNPLPNMSMYVLDAMFSDLKRPGDGAASVDSVEFVILNDRGEEIPESKVVETRDDILTTSRFEQERRALRYTRQYELGPKGKARVRLTVTSYEPMQDGSIAVTPRLPTANMSLVCSFPDSSFERAVYFSHSKRDQRLTCRASSGPIETRAEIRGGVLPYQGITVTWGRKASGQREAQGIESTRKKRQPEKRRRG